MPGGRGGVAARACVAAAALLAAGAARAQTLTVSVPASTTYVENAITVGLSSPLTLQVSHNATDSRYQVEVRMPLLATALGGTGPAGWTATTYTSGLYQGVRFTADCALAGGGLVRNTPARFTVNVRTLAGLASADARSSGFTVTASTTRRSDGRCRSGSSLSADAPQVWSRVLALSGAGTALQQLAPPAVVRWSVSNYASVQKTGVKVTPLPSGTSCGSLTVAAYGGSAPGTGTVRCTYPATAGRTFGVVATATGTSNASAVGASVAGVDVGNATVAWSRSTLVRGRVRDPVVIVVDNASRATISRVDVIPPSSGWAVSSASTSSAGLSYSPGATPSTSAVFTGTVAAGARVTLTLRYAAIPAGTSFAFQVKLTPSSGDDYAVTYGPQTVTVRPLGTPPPDVSRLTIRSDAAGQTLQWTNPAASHAGVVVLRAAAPAVPSPPVDFVDYAAEPTSEVVYANRSDPSVHSAVDPTVGAFNYLVCSHDAGLVYSECSTSAAARVGYSGNSAVAPAGGWTVQVGGEALAPLQVYAAGRAAVPSSRGDVSVVTLADGRRAITPDAQEIAPIQVTATLPSTYMPGWRLANGKLVALAADEAGWITAIDLEAGTQYWRVRKNGESFAAGVSGVAASGGAAAFRAAYPGMDVLFLGSATTGNVLAIRADTGATLWTISTGAPGVDTLTSYDAATNYLWVPTSTGVQAWDLGRSGPAASTPARRAWTANVGAHSTYCVRTTIEAWMACVSTTGTLRLLDKASGAVKVTLETGVTLPSTVVRVAYGTPGFIVGNGRQVARVVAADATLTRLSVGSRWQPSGWTLSPVVLFSASGYLIVGASDLTTQGLHLYKRSSEDLSPLARSPDTVQAADRNTLIGPPSYDSTDRLYLFGTAEGRVWAIPSF